MGQQFRQGVRSSAKAAINAALFASAAGLASGAYAQEGGPLADPQSQEGNTAATVVEQIEAVGSKPVESPKYTAPLQDTPQTITIVPQAVIEAQNLLTLRDILSTVPGITFGAGEGGGGFGDSINLRGYTATSDITTDGVRDSAQYTRSDTFNLEQLEVTNGANGAVAGSGSVGGSINLVSKRPIGRDVTTASLGVGTDSYLRATLDANKEFNDSVAGRLNLMFHSSDMPGREVETVERYGIAPSLTIGMNSDTRFTLQGFYQHDDNIPQYGTFFYNGRPVPTIDPSLYFGYSNLDKQEIDVASGTLIIEHDFSSNMRLRNLTRYQEVDQLTIVNPPQGAPCLANGLKPVGWSQTAAYNGARQLIITENTSGFTACLATDPAPGFYRPGGPRGNLRDTHNTTFYNQIDLTAEFETGGLKHSLNAGVSLLSETFYLDTGNIQRLPTGATPVFLDMDITNPDTVYTGPLNFIRSSEQTGERRNQSLYVFDTIEFNDQFQINGGFRFDHNEGVNSTDTYQATPSPTIPLGTVTPGPKFRNEEDLFSYRIGAVFKPVPNASLYAAYGNSQTPSQSAVNGACNATTCNVDPEEAENIEIGAKWDVFDGRLSLTGAVFRNERTNYKVASGDPTVADQVLDGSSRVDGITLGASGKLTDKWAVFFNYTFLDSEVLQGVSDFNAGGGVAGSGNEDFLKGDPLTSVPDHAFSLFSTYDWNDRLQFGWGVTYQGEYYLTQHFGIVRPALAAGGGQPAIPAGFAGRSTIPLVVAEDYFVHRFVVTWGVTDRVELRLNVNNVFDEEYYTRGRNNGWATPGDTQNATLTLNYRF